jgi:DNA polymerase III subunit delta
MIYKSYLAEQNINGIKENLFLFYGENIGLKEDFKKIIKLNNKKAEILVFLEEEIIKNEDRFFNEVLNISLFEEEKIYFIDQATDKVLSVIEKVITKLDNQKIYLFSELLDKKSKLRSYYEKSNKTAAIACYPDNEISIKNIILNKLKGFKGMSSQNINMIKDNCNLDRAKLNNELSKILTFFKNKELSSDKLEMLLDVKVNDNFNLLKDEALKGDKVQTNQLLSDTLMDSEKSIYYLNVINQRLNKLAETFNLEKKTSLVDAVNMIKPPIFWKDKPSFLIQAKKWNLLKIKKILSKTYDIEINFKTNGNINKKVLMKKLIVDICELANA